jgi:hypothetical protein
MSNITTTQQGFAPATLTEAMAFSEMLAKSSMVPRAYQGKAEDVLVAMQWGREIGLAPLQALQNIAVINGKPSVYGDAAMALVQASPVCEDIEETIEGEGTPNPVAVCIAKRKGRKPVVARFSLEDAKRAGLWGKPGPWQAYPKRMMQMRARGFALRDAFPDILKGLITVEEAQDYPDRDRPANVVNLPRSRNPLEAIPMSEITQPVEQTEDPQREYVEVEQVNQMLQEEAESRTDEVLTPAAEASIVEQLTKQFEDAGIEVVEVVDKTWALGIPGKPDLPCEGYEDWAKQYEEMADKVAKSKLAPEAKLAKLEELKKSNQRIFSMLKMEQSLQHTKHMVTRRTQIEAALAK